MALQTLKTYIKFTHTDTHREREKKDEEKNAIKHLLPRLDFALAQRIHLLLLLFHYNAWAMFFFFCASVAIVFNKNWIKKNGIDRHYFLSLALSKSITLFTIRIFFPIKKSDE